MRVTCPVGSRNKFGMTFVFQHVMGMYEASIRELSIGNAQLRSLYLRMTEELAISRVCMTNSTLYNTMEKFAIRFFVPQNDKGIFLIFTS